MPVGIWKSKPFWDRLDIYGSLGTAICAFLAVVMPADYKGRPALGALLIASIGTVSKLRAKRIDEDDKAEKARADDADRVRVQQTIARLRAEEENCDERLANAQAELRREHEARVKCLAEEQLGALHSKYFRKETNNEDTHKHRTTLFKCVDDTENPGNGKRLAIYARVGVFRDSSSSWPVDENIPEKCRGVAGKIWFHGSPTVATAACEWPNDPNNQTDKARYAESLNITVDEAERLNVKSRMFTGVRIMVQGRKWGVILLDSAKEGHIEDTRRQKTLLSEYAVLIGSILSRMES